MASVEDWMSTLSGPCFQSKSCFCARNRNGKSSTSSSLLCGVMFLQTSLNSRRLKFRKILVHNGWCFVTFQGHLNWVINWLLSSRLFEYLHSGPAGDTLCDVMSVVWWLMLRGWWASCNPILVCALFHALLDRLCISCSRKGQVVSRDMTHTTCKVLFPYMYICSMLQWPWVEDVLYIIVKCDVYREIRRIDNREHFNPPHQACCDMNALFCSSIHQVLGIFHVCDLLKAHTAC